MEQFSSRFAKVAFKFCNQGICHLYIHRSKTIHLEKLKVKILHLMETLKTEDEHLSGYKAEVEHLKREKMLLIESLRHIEQDLTLV